LEAGDFLSIVNADKEFKPLFARVKGQRQIAEELAQERGSPTVAAIVGLGGLGADLLGNAEAYEAPSHRLPEDRDYYMTPGRFAVDKREASGEGCGFAGGSDERRGIFNEVGRGPLVASKPLSQPPAAGSANLS
jgi:hypothetical protein